MGVGNTALAAIRTDPKLPELTNFIVIVLGKSSTGKTTFIEAVRNHQNGEHAQQPAIEEWSSKTPGGVDITLLEVPSLEGNAWSKCQIVGKFSELLSNKREVLNVAGLLYVYKTLAAPCPVDLFHLEFMLKVAGSLNYNHVDLVFNNHLQNLPAGGFPVWKDALVQKGFSIATEPIIYYNQDSPDIVMDNYQRSGQVVTLNLIHELEKHHKKYHKTAIGQRITELFAEEEEEVKRNIQVKEQEIKGQKEKRVKWVKLFKKKTASEKQLERERTASEEQLEREKKELELKLSKIKNGKRWWIEN